MVNYYVALQTKSHALLLEQRLKQQKIKCELAFMPRPIMNDLCSMGVKLREAVFNTALPVIRGCGLPGLRIYRETVNPKGSQYDEIKL